MYNLEIQSMQLKLKNKHISKPLEGENILKHI